MHAVLTDKQEKLHTNRQSSSSHVAYLQVYNTMVDKRQERNIITYSSLIAAADRAGQWQQGLTIWHHMSGDRCHPNLPAYNSAVSCSAQGTLLQSCVAPADGCLMGGLCMLADAKSLPVGWCTVCTTADCLSVSETHQACDAGQVNAIFACRLQSFALAGSSALSATLCNQDRCTHCVLLHANITADYNFQHSFACN